MSFSFLFVFHLATCSFKQHDPAPRLRMQAREVHDDRPVSPPRHSTATDTDGAIVPAAGAASRRAPKVIFASEEMKARRAGGVDVALHSLGGPDGADDFTITSASGMHPLHIATITHILLHVCLPSSRTHYTSFPALPFSLMILRHALDAAPARAHAHRQRLRGRGPRRRRLAGLPRHDLGPD